MIKSKDFSNSNCQVSPIQKLDKKLKMSVSGEPRVLSMTMHGFDDEKVTGELEEGRSSSNNSADSPDSSSRYTWLHIY